MRLLVSLTAAAVLLALPAAADAETRQVRLLHVNDVYEIGPDRDGLGGFGPLARLIAEHEPALVTFGGDLISPSVLSSLTRGAHMVSLMNAVGTDVAVVGNHEFDFGPEVFAERLDESAFPWLAANLTGVAGVKAREIREVGGVTVGLFGVVTPETATLSSPGAGVGFSDPLAAAKEQAAALRAEGAEVVVALTHLTLEEDLAVGRIGGIDVVLGGHDHEPWAHHDGDTLILKAGYNARFLAVVDLAVETGGKQPQVTAGWSMVPVSAAADPAVAAKVASFQQELDGALAAPLATLAAELDSRRSTVRGREAAIGTLIADAMRAATGADVALTNGGGIRGDRTYAAGSTLTRGDVLAELPFGNVVEVVRLTGAQLRAALEHGVSAVEQGAGRFPQVSGLRLTYDPAAQPGARVGAVTVGQAPLDPAATYTVAVNDYIGRGGDGYAVLVRAPRTVSAEGGRLLSTVVMDALAAAGTVAPATDGRITAAR